MYISCLSSNFPEPHFPNLNQQLKKQTLLNNKHENVFDFIAKEMQITAYYMKTLKRMEY